MPGTFQRVSSAKWSNLFSSPSLPMLQRFWGVFSDVYIFLRGFCTYCTSSFYWSTVCNDTTIHLLDPCPPLIPKLSLHLDKSSPEIHSISAQFKRRPSECRQLMIIEEEASQEYTFLNLCHLACILHLRSLYIVISNENLNPLHLNPLHPLPHLTLLHHKYHPLARCSCDPILSSSEFDLLD